MTGSINTIGRQVAPTGADPVLSRSTSPRSTAPAFPHTLRSSEAQLALVQGLIRTGELRRALELLDALWNRERPGERPWYLRLWILVGQGRVLEALELSRAAATELPGSAAVAWLQAVLEQAHGRPEAAVEAAIRAAALRPGSSGPEQLLSALLGDGEADGARHQPRSDAQIVAVEVSPEGPVPLWLDLPRAALLGAQFLLPWGSPQASLAPVAGRPRPAASTDVPNPADHRQERRRLWLMAGAVVLAAVIAVKEPLLAAAALALVVGWLSRPLRRPAA